jgi:hypothetical protein
MRGSDSAAEVSTFSSWNLCFHHRLVLEGVFNGRVYGVASSVSSISVLGWNMILFYGVIGSYMKVLVYFPPCLGSILLPIDHHRQQHVGICSH